MEGARALEGAALEQALEGTVFWTRAGSGVDSVSSLNRACSGVASLSSWTGAGSGVDFVSSLNRACSGEDSVSSWTGACSGVASLSSWTGAGS